MSVGRSGKLKLGVSRRAGRAFMLRTRPLRVLALRVSIPHASAPFRPSALRLASAPVVLRALLARSLCAADCRAARMMAGSSGVRQRVAPPFRLRICRHLHACIPHRRANLSIVRSASLRRYALLTAPLFRRCYLQAVGNDKPSNFTTGAT